MQQFRRVPSGKNGYFILKGKHTENLLHHPNFIKVVLPLFCLINLLILGGAALHVYVFADELNLICNPFRFLTKATILPYYTNYPTFYSYLITLPISIVALIIYFINKYPLSGLSDPLFIEFVLQENYVTLTKTARLLTVMIAITILIIIFYYCYKNYGRLCALLAATILTLDPLTIYFQHSRFALPDILVAFLITIAMLLIFNSIEKQNTAHFYWACFFTGLATSTKFNAVFMILPIIVLFILRKNLNMPAFLKKISLPWALLIILGGLLIGSPAFLIKPGIYLEGFQEEADLLFYSGDIGAHQKKWTWILENLWERDPALAVIFIFTIFSLFQKLDYRKKIFLSLLLPSIAVIGNLEKKSIHYLLFLYPLLSAEASRVLAVMWDRLKNAWAKGCYIVLLLTIIGFWATKMYQRAQIEFKIDNRILAAEWIYKNIPPHSKIIVDTRGYEPRLSGWQVLSDTENFKFKSKELFDICIATLEKKIEYEIFRRKYKKPDWNKILEINAPYFITSNVDYDRYFKAGSANYIKTEAVMKLFRQQKAFYEDLLSGRSPYHEIITFDSGSGPIQKIYQLTPK